MTFHMELWIIKQGTHMDRRNHVTDTKLLENIQSRSQVATQEPSSTTLTSMVSMLMYITAMETIILEVATEGMGVAMEGMVVATEGMEVATEGMGVAMEATAIKELAEDMQVAVIMFMAATAIILSMMTTINAHVVCLADAHLNWHLMELLSFYSKHSQSKNFKLNFF